MSQPPSERAIVKRKPQRAAYDREAIDKVLDEGLFCHVAFALEGQPFAIPMIHVRVADKIYLHGSPASRLLQALAAGTEACLAVTLIDGIVLARAATNHSLNYRSIVLFGKASVVEAEEEKMTVLRELVEHVIPGRWSDTRWPTHEELRRTMVLSIPIEEATAKTRTGPPLDDEADHELSHWAGVIPRRLIAGNLIADPKLKAGIKPPTYAVANVSPHSLQENERVQRTDIASTETNKAIIRRYYQELWNEWRLDLADALIAIDVSFLGSLGIRVGGRASFVDYVHFVRRAFPDFHNSIEEMIADGDKVVVRLNYSGTHQGELFDIQATGRRVTYSGVAIFRIADSKIAEGWVLGDTRGLIQQLQLQNNSHSSAS